MKGYIYIYMYIYIYVYMYIYIYIYIYNPHLRLINVPPPLFCFSLKLYVSLFNYYQNARNILNSGQHFINTFYDTGDTGWAVILGVILGIIHFLKSETPKQVISCRRKVLIKSDIFWDHPQYHPQDHSKMTQSCIVCFAIINLSLYFEVPFY